MSKYYLQLSNLLQARRTTLPKRLVDPGPNAEQFNLILSAASHAPDHGRLVPWRFIVIPRDMRVALGEVFAQDLVRRDPTSLPEQIRRAREKALRAPELLILVVDATSSETGVSFHERLISAGCAVQNMLLMTTALGFGSALTSGKALRSKALHSMLRLGAQEHAICFMNIGTVQQVNSPRIRPDPNQYVQHWHQELAA